ncbi:class I SAM-dependent methyltransferase [Rhodoplanes azumiensis]|uniref:Class I SAM-dependent methyltransferase n=2 Tax=Rhodoplanes azumiensis TaxID=1897628 RepID=A0ABW5ANY2_9BRAD
MADYPSDGATLAAEPSVTELSTAEPSAAETLAAEPLAATPLADFSAATDREPGAMRPRTVREAVALAVSRYRPRSDSPDPARDQALVASVASHSERVADSLDTVIGAIPKGGTVADIGGGLTPCCHALSLLGYRTLLIDDFGDRGYADAAWILDQKRRDGVEIRSCDVLSSVPLEESSVDAVITFDCLEHLHHSPKAMLRQCVAALKPGGFFFLGVPNCVNLRKRLTVPFGIGKWSTMADWWESDVFRGHVREPDVEDLAYIAKSLGLENVRIFGRNWLGYESRFGFVRLLTPAGDRILRLFPSLCANIYVCGTRPAA